MTAILSKSTSSTSTSGEAFHSTSVQCNLCQVIKVHNNDIDIESPYYLPCTLLLAHFRDLTCFDSRYYFSMAPFDCEHSTKVEWSHSPLQLLRLHLVCFSVSVDSYGDWSGVVLGLLYIRVVLVGFWVCFLGTCY